MFCPYVVVVLVAVLIKSRVSDSCRLTRPLELVLSQNATLDQESFIFVFCSWPHRAISTNTYVFPYQILNEGAYSSGSEFTSCGRCESSTRRLFTAQFAQV